MKTYRKRIDDILKRKLKGKSAVAIKDSKWCGKTTTEQQAASVLYMNGNLPKSYGMPFVLKSIAARNKDNSLNRFSCTNRHKTNYT